MNHDRKYVAISIGVVTTCLIGILVVKGSGILDQTELRNAGIGNGTVGVFAEVDAPWSFGLGTLCSTGSVVAIDDVVPLRPTGGLKVLSWIIRRNPWQGPSVIKDGVHQLLEDPQMHVEGTFRAMPGDAVFPNAKVSAPCLESYEDDNSPILSQLGVTVARSDSGVTACAGGFLITYHVGALRKTLIAPTDINLYDKANGENIGERVCS